VKKRKKSNSLSPLLKKEKSCGEQTDRLRRHREKSKPDVDFSHCVRRIMYLDGFFHFVNRHLSVTLEKLSQSWSVNRK
jgi:hypothetical protein